MKFAAAAYSAKGMRDLNEDSFIIGSKTSALARALSEVSCEGDDQKPCFFAVADGMGGQGSGEIASNLVVTKLLEICETISEFNSETLTMEIEKIHEAVLARDGKMGSTLAGVVFQKGQCGIVNLGDSRVYRMRDGMFLRMSNDDSLKRFVAGAASNIITNGIGGGLKSINVNCRFSDKMITAGDRFLICSDGAHGFVDDAFIEKTMGENIPPVEIAARIARTAMQNGSDDNCSAVAVEFKE